MSSSNPIKRHSDEYHRRKRLEAAGLGGAYEDKQGKKNPTRLRGDGSGVGARIIRDARGKKRSEASKKLSGLEQSRRARIRAEAAEKRRAAIAELSPEEKKRLTGAAKAVAESIGKLGKTVGDSAEKLKLVGGKSPNPDPASDVTGQGEGGHEGHDHGSGGDGDGDGGKGGQRSHSRAASAVAKSQEKSKPGKAYEKTRSYWKDEGEKAKRFDTEMTGDEVRAARKEFLRTHPAARRAVKNGTMSMGDINIMVRRLSKRKKSRQG